MSSTVHRTIFEGLINSNMRVMDHQNWAGVAGKDSIFMSRFSVTRA